MAIPPAATVRDPRPAVRWLDPVEMAAWRNYVETVGVLHQAIEADLAPFGLTLGDYEVLVHLSDQPEHRLRMCDLAGRLRLTPSGLTRRLDGLVRHGLVCRQPSSEDRREMLAVLTDDGFDLLERAAPDHLASVRAHFVDVLTAAEIRTLASAFTKLRAAHDAKPTGRR